RELAAGVGRLERQARHRVHLERRADDEEERRLAGERERAVDRLRGEELAEEDDVGLQDPAAVQAGRRAAAGPLEELEHVLERIPSAAPGAGRAADRAVHLDDLAAAGPLVQEVDVLRDYRADEPRRLEPGE